MIRSVLRISTKILLGEKELQEAKIGFSMKISVWNVLILSNALAKFQPSDLLFSSINHPTIHLDQFIPIRISQWSLFTIKMLGSSSKMEFWAWNSHPETHFASKNHSWKIKLLLTSMNISSYLAISWMNSKLKNPVKVILTNLIGLLMIGVNWENQCQLENL